MIRIAICDDNASEVEYIQDIVLGFTKENPDTDFFIRPFTSAFELLDNIIGKSGFHIYLLDILMPNISGIDLGESIRQKDDLAIIIYLTSTMDYALKSFSVFAFQYLLKPVAPTELHGVLKKALLKIGLERNKIISLRTKDGITAIRYHQIIFVEYSNHSLRFHLTDGTIATSVSLREPFESTANQLLQDSRFVRPHKAFIINMHYVHTLTANEFIMTNESQIAVSKKKYTAIKKQYIDFLLSREAE